MKNLKDRWYRFKIAKVGDVFILILAVTIIWLVLEYNTLTADLKDTESRLAESEETVASLTGELERAKRDVRELFSIVQREEQENAEFAKQLKENEETIDVLNKLREIDPELLQKYSKVYFLNEHYMPDRLVDIQKQYTYRDENTPEDKMFRIHADVWPHLDALVRGAKRSGIGLRVISAYRSFDDQEELKTGYVITYGAGTANQFSAEQGYSEHQLGTTVDFTTEELGASFGRFDETDAYGWMRDNAHRFGFILSYPKGNEYYQYEPWHWRFVGIALAEYIYEEETSFYAMDQRDIDAYLINLFD